MEVRSRGQLLPALQDVLRRLAKEPFLIARDGLDREATSTPEDHPVIEEGSSAEICDVAPQ
jgi:hypothetical protein